MACGWWIDIPHWVHELLFERRKLIGLGHSSPVRRRLQPLITVSGGSPETQRLRYPFRLQAPRAMAIRAIRRSDHARTYIYAVSKGLLDKMHGDTLD